MGQCIVLEIVHRKDSGRKKTVSDLEAGQMSLFDLSGSGANNAVIEKLKGIKVDELRPVDALNLLAELQGMIDE